MNTPKEGGMIKQVFIRKHGKAWLLPISTWLGICKDGAKGAGYAFAEEYETDQQGGFGNEILVLDIDNWQASDFEEFIRSYQLGNIKPPKVELVVPKQVQLAKAPEPTPVAEAKPKAKKPAAKKPRSKK